MTGARHRSIYHQREETRQAEVSAAGTMATSRKARRHLILLEQLGPDRLPESLSQLILPLRQEAPRQLLRSKRKSRAVFPTADYIFVAWTIPPF